MTETLCAQNKISFFKIKKILQYNSFFKKYILEIAVDTLLFFSEQFKKFILSV